MDQLVGIGLYTPAEVQGLLAIPAGKVSRWLRGHRANGQTYAALWEPQINLGDGRLYLSFRELMEIRVADAFIRAGVSSQRVRAAIELARNLYGEHQPLSTDRFRTDGRNVFLRVMEPEGRHDRERLIDTFRRQYAFAEIIEPSLKGVEFDPSGVPLMWRPHGRRGQIVVDPSRSFGQPIDETSSVPTAILAAAGRIEGVANAARAYDVPPSSVRRALDFEAEIGARRAA